MHSPRKRFGQNFLRDAAVIDAILATACPRTGEHWVEIGPGLGALTEPLIKAAARLDVIELDRDLAGLLKKKFAGAPHLKIFSADALGFDFSGLVENGEKLRIIGNLPYNISTPLLFHLAAFAPVIRDLHVMLQKEVVNRICATPGGKVYGRLSVMMQYHFQTEPLFEVAPDSFRPAPKVLSAVLRLAPHLKPPVDVKDPAVLIGLVTEAFSQRRKTLRNSLKKRCPESLLLESGIDPDLRPENLTLADFAKLSNQLAN